MELGSITITTTQETLGGSGFCITAEKEEGKKVTFKPIAGAKGLISWKLPITKANIAQILKSYYPKAGYFVEMIVKPIENPFEKKVQMDANKAFVENRKAVQEQIDKKAPEAERLYKQLQKQRETLATREQDYLIVKSQEAAKKAKASPAPKTLLESRKVVADLEKKLESTQEALTELRAKLGSV